MVPVKGRTYRSPLREEQARATRERLAAGAVALFAAKGYQATTVAEIAAAAGVSVPTVHATFEGKRGLARHLLREAISGAGAPAEQRPDAARILDARDGGGKLHEFCMTSARIGERGAQIYRILLGAAGDPEIAALLRQIDARRFEQMAVYADDLAASGLLATAVDRDRARDILYWAGSPGLYLQMVTDIGWAVADFVEWLEAALTGMLLATT